MRLIVGVDIESTGNDPLKDRIIELAIYAIDADTSEPVIQFSSRYNPEMNIAPKAAQVHGITNADVLTCPTFASKAGVISALLKKADLLVAHNGDEFDVIMLKAEFQRIGVEYPASLKTFDTMKSGRWATPDGKYPTLGELCWALSVDYDREKAHAALFDTQVLMQAYQRAVALGLWEAI
jgi:DNA polymerase-3 subunit epsilon